MANDQKGQTGEERFWEAVDAASLAASDEARDLAREAIAKRSLSSEGLSETKAGQESPRPDGLAYEPQEMERILKDYFLTQASLPTGVGAQGGSDKPVLAKPLVIGEATQNRGRSVPGLDPNWSLSQSRRPPRTGLVRRLMQALERRLRS